MQAPNWTDFLQCSICTNKFDQLDVIPISLTCGHTLCTRCLCKLKTRTCPYDKVAIRPDVESFPANAALLHLLGHKVDAALDNVQVKKLSESDRTHYGVAVSAILELSLFLQPLAEHGITAAITYLTKPMLKKLVTVLNCQVLESDGRVRAMRAARSIADRTVTELLVMHQNQQQISTLLWTAVRNRGCQFLGPVMQEEALRLILRVLESGNSLSRKNIVLFVVQRLSNDFPQASKTSVGHVVQLLYRASCFNVEKRDDDSSLMQLKEEFRSYECLRREHDGQIIRMAMEAGLRISPEQWSTLLYGDHKHKSDMQSIIDKLIAQGAASSGLSELIVAVGRSQDPYQLSEKVVPHLETIFKVPVAPDKNAETVEWENFATVMQALLATLHGFSTFMQIQNGRFKTGMCPHLSKPGGCPKGERCTYAHSEEERDRFRSMVKPVKLVKPRTGEQFRLSGVKSRSGDHGAVKSFTDSHSSVGSFELVQGGPSSLPEHRYSDLIRYSGEQMRVSGRPAPMTAPVLTQDWRQGGVANVDNGLSSYKPLAPVYGTVNQVAINQAAVNQVAINQAAINQVAVNQAAINQAAANQAAVNQALSSKIDMLRLQHKAVNQSIDNYSLPSAPTLDGAYPRELLPAPATAPAYVDYSQPPRPAEWVAYSQLTPDLQQPDSVVTQQFLNSMDKLELSGPPPSNSLHSNSSGSCSYPSDAATNNSSAVQIVSPEPSLASSTAAVTTTANPANSESGAITMATTTSSQNEMAAEIERLKEKLREQEQLIQQQQQQPQYGSGEGMGRTGPPQQPPAVVSQYSAHYPQYPAAGNPQYGSPQYPVAGNPTAGNPQYSAAAMQQLYNTGTGMMIPAETQPAAAAATNLLAPHSYPGAPVQQYSTKQLQAAAMAAALVGSQPTNSGGGGAFYPAAPPPAGTPSYPSHWSSPQVYPHSSQAANSGIIMTAPLPILPSTAQPRAMMDSDDMLAAYIQMMEQSKASGPPYQATSTYNPAPVTPQYYYQH